MRTATPASHTSTHMPQGRAEPAVDVMVVESVDVDSQAARRRGRRTPGGTDGGTTSPKQDDALRSLRSLQRTARRMRVPVITRQDVVDALLAGRCGCGSVGECGRGRRTRVPANARMSWVSHQSPLNACKP